MFSSYLTQTQKARDEFAGLAVGLPNIEGLIVVKRVGTVTTYLEIIPAPYINNVPAKMVALFDQAGVKVGVNDFEVKGISAKYTEAQLSGNGISYIVGAVMAAGVPVGGIACNDVMGTIDKDRSGNCWDLVLTRKQRDGGIR